MTIGTFSAWRIRYTDRRLRCPYIRREADQREAWYGLATKCAAQIRKRCGMPGKKAERMRQANPILDRRGDSG
jgi:hypothetical protein